MGQSSKIVTIKKQYQCEACEAVYDRRSEAEDCCHPEVLEVYVCPICHIAQDKEADAIKCCNYGQNDPLPPSAEELEKHGQLRLEAVK